MMWDHVMERLGVEISADAVIGAIIGENYRASATGAQLIPSIEWTLIGDTEGELWAPMIVQFDIWTEKSVHERTLERRLRQLYHRDLPRVLDGVQMFMEYIDGTTLSVPDRSGFSGRAVRFQFTPLREKYALSTL